MENIQGELSEISKSYIFFQVEHTDLILDTVFLIGKIWQNN